MTPQVLKHWAQSFHAYERDPARARKHWLCSMEMDPAFMGYWTAVGITFFTYVLLFASCLVFKFSFLWGFFDHDMPQNILIFFLLLRLLIYVRNFFLNYDLINGYTMNDAATETQKLILREAYSAEDDTLAALVVLWDEEEYRKQSGEVGDKQREEETARGFAAALEEELEKLRRAREATPAPHKSILDLDLF